MASRRRVQPDGGQVITDAIVGNKAIENAAIAFVIEYERRCGRAARDARYQGAAADIESADRVIEVKATARSAGFLMVESGQVEEAHANPNLYIYLVENAAQGDRWQFGLRILGGETLRRLLGHAKQRRYYEVPLPAGEYDALRPEDLEIE